MQPLIALTTKQTNTLSHLRGGIGPTVIVSSTIYNQKPVEGHHNRKYMKIRRINNEYVPSTALPPITHHQSPSDNLRIQNKRQQIAEEVREI